MSRHGDFLPGWPGLVLHLNSVESTQDLARRMAEEGSPEWTTVLADRQTKGRGRMDRRWDSSKGGLYLSIILRPTFPPTFLAHLSLSAAEAVAKALANSSGLRTAVKPPNDVLAAPPLRESAARAAPMAPPKAEEFRKVCGILVEASGTAARTDWVVIGIGVNVNNRTPSGLTDATSLADLAGREFDVRELARAILEEFRRGYVVFLGAYR